MGVFGRKKKSGFGASSLPESQENASSSETGPLSSRAAAFSRMFSGKSFKGARFRGLGSLPVSPVSVTEEDGKTFEGEEIKEKETLGSDNDSIIEHHSVSPLSPLSPVMAAIEARTFASEKKDSSQTFANTARDESNIFPDRPEKKRATRGPAAVMVRKGLKDSPDLSEHWVIDFNTLTFGKTIGHSSFGTVNEGKLNGTKVAVKTILHDPNPSAPNNLTLFKKEAELNCKLRHPNIVLFMGISVQPTKVCVVTELMSRGNVRDLLVGLSKGKHIRLDWNLRQQWALDTAQGMAYLHSLEPPIIHRDLKTTNLLVDRGMNVKICDFGLSRFKSDKLMSAVGTVQFAAPEVLRHERYTEKADLFSFGTVMWELYTRECVFKGMPQIEVYNSVVNGDMPSVDEECDERYRKLMNACWATDAVDRPSFRDVIDSLSVLVEECEKTT